MPALRRPKRGKKKALKRARGPRGPRLLAVQPYTRRSTLRTELLGMACQVSELVEGDETVILKEPLGGRSVIVPISSLPRDARYMKALGLKVGQIVWLSLRPA